MGRSRSWIWKHIHEVNEKGIFKCNLCDERFGYKANCQIKYHLYHEHKIYNNKEVAEWKNDTNDLIWQYFLKQDGYIVRCKICNKLFKYTYRTQILIRHLNSAHEHIINAKQEIIAHSWLSRHIIFKDWRVLCNEKDCSYSTSIFKKTDVLKSHLECHNINRYSGCEKKTEDSKAEGIIQQSVDKTNCAGPSSHHDNTQKQPLKNQESLQGYQHNRQQDPEFPKIWKPYI